MVREIDLNEIRESWRRETDKYVLRAAKENIESYSPPVREIIIEEANRRGLITDEDKRDSGKTLIEHASIHREHRAGKGRWITGVVISVIYTLFLGINILDNLFSFSGIYEFFLCLSIFLLFVIFGFFSFTLAIKNLEKAQRVYDLSKIVISVLPWLLVGGLAIREGWTSAMVMGLLLMGMFVLPFKLGINGLRAMLGITAGLEGTGSTQKANPGK